jgi:hypothetical protein
VCRATPTINKACSEQTEKQPTAALAIFQFHLCIRTFDFVHEIHDCLAKMNDDKAKKALAPIVRPRARFSYDDLYGYLIVTVPLLQPSASIGFHLSEVPFLVPGLEYLPILKDHTQAPGKPKVLQQPRHGCRQNFRRAHFAAELDEALLLFAI